MSAWVPPSVERSGSKNQNALKCLMAYTSLAQHECKVAGVWLHGEAVAAGTVMAADMSYRLGWIEQDILDRTVRLLKRAKLPIAAPAVSP